MLGMKKYLMVLAGLFLAIFSFAQDSDPVTWSFTAKKVNATTYELRLSAKLANGWHTYSQSTPAGGPVPTEITFTKNPLVTLSGTVKETGKLEQHFEPLFGVDVKQYSNKVDFVQTITVKPGVKTAVKGSVEYMVCNDHECLPPVNKSFTISLK
jgi:DsbC/DsbD-like thiol-disulfide interchange protein